MIGIMNLCRSTCVGMTNLLVLLHDLVNNIDQQKLDLESLCLMIKKLWREILSKSIFLRLRGKVKCFYLLTD